jgi:hypothetical protein
MLTWLYDLLISFVSFILGLFGVQMNKKSVSFASDAKEEEKKEDDVVNPNADVLASAPSTPVAE